MDSMTENYLAQLAGIGGRRQQARAAAFNQYGQQQYPPGYEPVSPQQQWKWQTQDNPQVQYWRRMAEQQPEQFRMAMQKMQAELDAAKAERDRYAQGTDIAGKTYDQVTVPESQAKIRAYDADTGLATAKTEGIKQDISQGAQLFPGELKEQSLTNEGLSLANEGTGYENVKKKYAANLLALRPPSKTKPGFYLAVDKGIRPDGTYELSPFESVADERNGNAERDEYIAGVNDRFDSHKAKARTAAFAQKYFDDPRIPLEQKIALSASLEGKEPKIIKGEQQTPPDRAAAMTKPGDRPFQGTYDIGPETKTYLLPGQTIPGELRGPRKPTLQEEMRSKLTPAQAAADAQKTAALDYKKKRDAENTKQQKRHEAEMNALRARFDKMKDTAEKTQAALRDKTFNNQMRIVEKEQGLQQGALKSILASLTSQYNAEFNAKKKAEIKAQIEQTTKAIMGRTSIRDALKASSDAADSQPEVKPEKKTEVQGGGAESELNKAKAAVATLGVDAVIAKIESNRAALDNTYGPGTTDSFIKEIRGAQEPEKPKFSLKVPPLTRGH